MNENKAEKALRWVVNTIPDFEPKSNEEKMLLTIKHYCQAGADEIKRLEAENAALRERLEKAGEHPFYVFDKKTGKEADVYEIALNEDWAKHLMYCDMDGFAIDQDGTLILIDECGQLYCPSGRFEICTESRLKELQGGEE